MNVFWCDIVTGQNTKMELKAQLKVQHVDVVSLTTVIYIFFYYKANLWLQNKTFLSTIEIITHHILYKREHFL